jgi:hypothetical protein
MSLRVPRKFDCTDRRGSAVVELALVLPLLMAIVFGAIQACNTIHAKQALVSAAYEGTRVVARPDATLAQTRRSIEAILDARSIQDYEISIVPGTELQPVPDGRRITIGITAPTAGNVFGPKFFDFSTELSVTAVAAR